MNAMEMMIRISDKLEPSERVDVKVTYARGHTLVEHYVVNCDGIHYSHRSWGGSGTVRALYKKIVLA